MDASICCKLIAEATCCCSWATRMSPPADYNRRGRGLFDASLGFVDSLNGSDYAAVLCEADEENPNSVMWIGYITRKSSLPRQIGERDVAELKRFLETEAAPDARPLIETEART